MELSDKTLSSLIEDIHKQKNEFIEQADPMSKAVFRTVLTFPEELEKDIYEADFYEVLISVRRFHYGGNNIEGKEEC